MTIKDALHFNLAGQYSYDFPIYNVNIDSGMQTERLTGNRELIKRTIRGRSKPYMIDIQENNFILPPLNFAFDFKEADDQLIQSVVDWLHEPTFRELYFSSDVNKRYFVVAVGDSEVTHNCLSQGYLTINFENIDHFIYSPQYLSEIYTFNPNEVEGITIEFTNNGSVPIFPEFYIKKLNGIGKFSIQNITDAGVKLEFEDIPDNTEIHIIGEEQEILNLTNPTSYLYGNHNDKWIRCMKGVNNLKILGDVELRIRWRAKLRS